MSGATPLQEAAEAATAFDLGDCIARLMHTKVKRNKPIISLGNFVAIVQRATLALQPLPNMIKLQGPMYIVGDLHGSINDIRHILSTFIPDIVNTAKPQEQNENIDDNTQQQQQQQLQDKQQTPYSILFLGDYVNRGHDSVEVLALVSCLKLKYPHRVHLLRVETEHESVIGIQGLQDELMTKYNYRDPMLTTNTFNFKTVKNCCLALFDAMPLCATVDNTVCNTRINNWLTNHCKQKQLLQFFCVHGGLAPELPLLSEVESSSVIRSQYNDIGIVCDLLNSSPLGDADETEQQNTIGIGWTCHDKGISFYFNFKVTEQFLKNNNTSIIIRSQQVFETGYKWMHNGNILTIFSHSNYMGFGNKAAIAEIDDLSNIKIHVL